MTWSRLSIGLCAGLLATLPMTLVMLIWHRLLPVQEQQPLPPEQVTSDMVEKAGAEDSIGRTDRRTFAWLLHFGFGAATGALYIGIADRLTRPAPVTGILFGFIVWAGSYFGWLPAFNIRGAARDQSASRNALMLVAHIVWGIVVGALAQALTRLSHGPQRSGVTARFGR